MEDMKEKIIFCRGGGCTAKLGAGALSSVLAKLPKKRDENLLVGFDSSDDAAVYRLNEDLAIVQTLDFFPPMVEDPYTFGKIAAANALSDIYAMGGTVKTALNIVCFPESCDLNILGEILRGGNEKVQEAGGVLAGGHSIMDTDIKYGLSVTGTIHPDKIYQNHGCQPGDVLILTKPLGIGIVTTANRVGEASGEAMQQAIASMTTLNRYAAEVLADYEVHACTDVAGCESDRSFAGDAAGWTHGETGGGSDSLYRGSTARSRGVPAHCRRAEEPQPCGRSSGIPNSGFCDGGDPFRSADQWRSAGGCTSGAEGDWRFCSGFRRWGFLAESSVGSKRVRATERIIERK